MCAQRVPSEVVGISERAILLIVWSLVFFSLSVQLYFSRTRYWYELYSRRLDGLNILVDHCLIMDCE